MDLQDIAMGYSGAQQPVLGSRKLIHTEIFARDAHGRDVGSSSHHREQNNISVHFDSKGTPILMDVTR